MSFRTNDDGSIRLPICTVATGCGQATVDRATLLHGTVDQVTAAVAEDAGASGLLLDPFALDQLRDNVREARAAVLHAADDR